MARFLSFVHAAQDIADFRNEFPENEFLYVSQNPIPGIRMVLRLHNLEEAIKNLQDEHRRRPFAGIVFGSGLELYVKIADHAARALGLRRFVSGPEAVRDKYVMRRAFRGKVASPETRLITAADDASRLPDLEFPCVLKPRHGFGSICVFKARDRKELASAQKGM